MKRICVEPISRIRCLNRCKVPYICHKLLDDYTLNIHTNFVSQNSITINQSCHYKTRGLILVGTNVGLNLRDSSLWLKAGKCRCHTFKSKLKLNESLLAFSYCNSKQYSLISLIKEVTRYICSYTQKKGFD